MALLEIHLQVLHSHLVISTRVAVPKLLFLPSCLCCRDVGPHEPNNKHSLKEHLWHVGSTTSTVASLRVARLGWLPSQEKLPLHGGWQSEKPDLPQHKPGSPGGKLVPTYNFAASPFSHYMICTQDHFRPC